jgi:hypothetical protein
MKESTTSVDAGRLVALAEKANKAHRHAQGAARRRVKHGLEAGRLLLEAKETVGHGNFTQWVEENFEGTPRHARRYMTLATAVEQNRIDPDEVSSLANAERLLREQDAEQTPGEYEPEEPDEEYEFWERGAESESREAEPEAQSPDLDEDDFDFDDDEEEEDDEPEQTQEDEPESASSKKSASKEPAPSKKKDVDPLHNAMKAIGRALGAASDEQRAAWAQELRDEINLYMGSLNQEEAA